MTKPPLGLLQRLRALLQRHEPDRIREQLERVDPYDAAWCLARLPVEDRLQMLADISPETGVRIFQELPLAKRIELLQLGRLPPLLAIMRMLDSDVAADVLGALDPLEKERWLATFPSQALSEAQSLLAYPADTAGGLMAKEFLSVPLNLTAAEVAARLQGLASSYENLKVTYVYVVDDKGYLRGVLPMRDLVFRPRETPIEKLMVTDVVTLPVTASQREVAELFRERNLLALPVITPEGKMAGVITADDVMDVIRDLANEELLKVSRVSLEESREAPIRERIRRRLSWLSINIVLDLMSASVVAFYSNTLQAVISLAFFLPIISDMSGCSGTQAVAISIRDLAVQKILPRDYFRVLRQEALVGLLNGLALGLMLAIVALVMHGRPALGAIVAVSLWLNTIIAVSVGGLLPLALKYLKFDPAVSSGPILTTITDMIGFFILLSLATWWLPWLTSPKS